MNRDQLFFGFFLGILIPILGVLLFYVFKYVPYNVPLIDFINLIKTNTHLIPKILSLGLIACIPLITYYKNRRRNKTLTGIFIAILFYALIIILYKFNFL
ncbi:MAG: hypothetical protein KA275_07535 [Chitinophagaceae bacterium]|nr:hypothetical protein [Chitinophagaceae bacterium]